MPWFYQQSTGELWLDGFLHAFKQGYSGFGDGKDNPDMQNVRGVGPIPEGLYTFQGPEDTKEHGPFAMPLAPDPDNVMFGRSGFLVHGDSFAHPGDASEGCIILPHWAREAMWASSDHSLLVVR